MKKVVAILCVLCMVFGMVGCGTSTTSTGELTTVTWYLPMNAQDDIQMIEDRAAEITVPLTNVKMDIVTIDTSSFGERMNMNMASALDFDLAFTGYLNPYQRAVQQGGVYDITDLLTKETPKLWESLPEYIWDSARVDGRIYGVPNLQGLANPTAAYYQTEYINKYNFDYEAVTKPEDMEPLFEKLKANEPDVYPYRPNWETKPWTDPVYEIIDATVVIRIDGSSPEVMYLYDTPEYKHAIETLHSWYEKGYIRKDLLSSGDATADMKAGKYPVVHAGWLPGAEINQKTQMGGRDVVAKPVMTPYMNRSAALSTVNSVGAWSKHPVEALKMLELMNTNKELYNTICFGIEGEHYEVVEEGKVRQIKDGGYFLTTDWMFGNQFNAFVREGQDLDVWEQTKALNESAIKSPLMGFVLDTDPIKNEISQFSAVKSEFDVGRFIVDGFKDWDEFDAKRKAAGSDKILAEIQKQVNEFWATK